MKYKMRIVTFLLGMIFLLNGCAATMPQSTSQPTEIQTAQDTVKSPAPESSPKIEQVQGTILEMEKGGFILQSEQGGMTLEFVLPNDASDAADGSQIIDYAEAEAGAVAKVSYYEDMGNYIMVDIEILETADEVMLNEREKRAEEILESMTLSEKIGQLFFVRCPEENAAETAMQYQPAGYILFDRDFKDKTKEEVIDSISSYQEAVNIAMLIGVDEEGGTVTRVGKYEQLCGEPFLSPQDLYQQGGMEQITEDAARKAEILLSLGINVNLAPVCDVSVNEEDFIYDRAFGQDADETAEYVRAVVRQMNESGIGCTLKHFPGYGSNGDTHTGIVRDERSYDEFLESDFVPFQAGIEQNAGSVLVCHNIVTSMDAELPASLSPAVHEILREELGFSGVVMTDDLYMDAIRDAYGTGEAAVLAVEAGNDLLISSEFEEQYEAVTEAVNSGRILENRIDESVKRVLCWKLSLGIIA